MLKGDVMTILRKQSGAIVRVLAALGVSLVLIKSPLAADSTVTLPLGQPGNKVAALKSGPTPARALAQSVIPPATLPPSPRGPLPLQTELLPLAPSTP